MRIIDISNDILTAEVYPGDPIPELSFVNTIENGDAYNLSTLSACMHNGTHVDAPLHFLENGDSIDKMPLETFIGPCTVLDMSPGLITGALVEEHFPRNTKRILLRSGGKAYIHKSAADALAYMGYELIGTDGLSVEAPDGDGDTHRALLGHNIALLEGLNLENAPAGNYFLIAPPLRVDSAEAAPARALLVSDYIFWSGNPQK